MTPQPAESTSGAAPPRAWEGGVLPGTSLLAALDALRVDPPRARTALLCVASGAAVIVALVSIVAGGRREMLRAVESAGPSNVFLRGGTAEGSAPLTTEALGTARARFGSLAGATGVRTAVTTIPAGSRRVEVPVHGVAEGIDRVFPLRVDSGRSLGAADFRSRSRAALLGASLAHTLSASGPLLGRRLDAAGETYEVVGVLRPLPADTAAAGTLPSVDWDRGLVVPLGAEPLAAAAPEERYPVDLAVLRFRSPAEAGRAARLLSEETAGRAAPFAVSTPLKALAQYRAARRSFDRVALLVSALTTLSAAFGVSNLLRAAVRARASEIGLRRAVGARQSDIRRQFLWEGFLLGAGGGALGVLLGAAVSLGVLSRAGWRPWFDPVTLLLLTGGSAAVGVAAGLAPAREAAALDPAAALRIE